MNALETEHSNLEIDSKLNRQPVKTYKWRCDVFMSWQWAHQSDCRVLHPLKIAKVRSGNTIQWAIAIIYSGFRYCLNNRLFLSIKKSFYPPNIMQMVNGPDWQVLLMAVFIPRWWSNHVPRFERCILQTLSRDQYLALICLSCPTARRFRLQLILFCHHLA